MNYHYFLLVVDPFLDYLNDPPIASLHIIHPHDFQLKNITNSGQLLSHPTVLNFINSFAGQKVIVPFKNSAKIEHLCQLHNFILAANSNKTCRFIEDKLNFIKICQQHKLPTIPSLSTTFNQASIKSAQEMFGTNRLVVQTHFGWAGKSTFSCHSWAEIEDKITIDTPVKITPYLEGYTLTTNNCVYHQQLLQSPPALQLTGIKPLTINPFATVGRQWPAHAPVTVSQQINQITQTFHEILSLDFGYLGFFGLDFFVNNQNQVFLLECNPRLTASYDFYTQLELKATLTPLFYYHLDQFAPQLMLAPPINRFDHQSIVGTHITAKDDHGNTKSQVRLDYAITQDPTLITLPSTLML